MGQKKLIDMLEGKIDLEKVVANGGVEQCVDHEPWYKPDNVCQKTAIAQPNTLPDNGMGIDRGLSVKGVNQNNPGISRLSDEDYAGYKILA